MQMPMPGPGAAGSPYFNGDNVTRFLENFKTVAELHGTPTERALQYIYLYCEVHLQGHVSSVVRSAGYVWDEVAETLKRDYWRKDYQQQVYSRTHLEKLSKSGEKREVLPYCQEFSAVGRELMKRGTLDNYSATYMFLRELPPKLLDHHVVSKKNVVLGNPATMDFKKIFQYTLNTQHSEVTVARLKGEDRMLEEPSILMQGQVFQDPTTVAAPTMMQLLYGSFPQQSEQRQTLNVSPEL